MCSPQARRRDFWKAVIEIEETKKVTGRWIITLAFVVIIISVYTLRLIDWQLINGKMYLETANTSHTYTVPIETKRGEILDANGVDLAINVTGHKIVFDRLYLKEGTENDIILQLIAIMQQKGEKWIDVLPIELSADGGFSFISGKEKEVEELKKILKLNSYTTAQNCMDQMAEKYGCTGLSNAQLRMVCSVRYNMTKSGYDTSMTMPYTFADDISDEMVAIISEKSQQMPGVDIRNSSIRKYVNGTIAPHIVGTIGKLSQEEYEELKDSYRLDEMIGKSGVEAAMEKYLRGTNGQKKIEATPGGSELNVIEKQNASPGNTVYLTIDAKLQQVANKSLAENVESAKKRYSDCKSGSVVVLDVNDFSVIAAGTYPTYDLGKYVDDNAYYNQIVSDDVYTPLVNRAFNGAFTPGSIYKPVVACAALEERAISDHDGILCTGRYNYYASSGFYIGCMGVHGDIAVRNALAKSCNVFFSEAGRRLGIEALDLYAKRFGLGVKTGVEVYESKGVLAGPEFSKSVGSHWYEGNTSQAAIGQSDNMFTPLQLATYTAVIANGGNRYKTHVVRKIMDYTRKNVVFENNPETPEFVENVGVSQENLQIVREGMRSVVTNGTATSFAAYPVEIAAKTGTAENNGSDHTTFICYAPFDKPKIAIAVVLEHGGAGIFSMDVARDILDAYFFGKGMEEITPTSLQKSESAQDTSN